MSEDTIHPIESWVALIIVAVLVFALPQPFRGVAAILLMLLIIGSAVSAQSERKQSRAGTTK